MRRLTCTLALGLCCAALVRAEVPVQPGDIAYGLSNGNAAQTALQVRVDGMGVGNIAGNWTQTTFLQAMEFDNYNGIAHNNAGNLLSLDFGTLAAGAELYQLSTDGSNAASLMFLFDGTGGAPLSRMSGLSVSPNNALIAAWAYDLGSVVVLDYNAGAMPGSGMGASASNPRMSSTIGDTAKTQGTAWLDGDTILVGTANGADRIRLYTVDFVAGAFSTITQRVERVTGNTGTQFVDVEYNPDVCPFVFLSCGQFVTPTTTNTIVVIDPSNWSVVRQLTMNTAETLREIALGPDGYLYMATFSAAISRFELDVAAPFGVIDAADIAALVDDTSVEIFDSAFSSSFSGIDVAFGVPAATGACCLDMVNCIETTQADCENVQSGTYVGDGVPCSTPNVCNPLGACCIPMMGCSDGLTNSACMTQGGTWLGPNTQCSPFACFLTPLPVESGDIAFGLSAQGAFETLQHVRNGNLVSRWTQLTFVQSTEFDNYNGVLHNAEGNLLALNFGGAGDCTDPMAVGQGGSLYNISTDGSDQGETIYRFNPNLGGIACTRISGLSVSPDNQYVACIGTDTGELYVLEYNEGATVGSGAGATITNAWSEPAAFSARTQGTTWLDDRTVMIHSFDPFGGADLTVIRVYDFDPIAMFPLTLLGDVSVPLPLGVAVGGSPFTDIEYNPTVSPYIYVMISWFNNPVSFTYLSVVNPVNPGNPATWTVPKTINISTSMNTGREIALGPDYRLYLGQFAGSTAPQPKQYIDVLELDLNGDDVIDAADTAGLTDNSTVDYYVLNGGGNSSFNGLDVAFGTSGPVCGTCGDSNCDGVVTPGDIAAFVAAVTGGENGWINWHVTNLGSPPSCDYLCANDADGNNLVTPGDIAPFVARLTQGTSCD